MCRVECVFHGENGKCMAPVAGSQSIEYATVYYCRPSTERKMEAAIDPNCFGSELKKNEENGQLNANVAESRRISP